MYDTSSIYDYEVYETATIWTEALYVRRKDRGEVLYFERFEMKVDIPNAVTFFVRANERRRNA